MSTKGKGVASRGEGMGAFYRNVACAAYPHLTSAEAVRMFNARDPKTGERYGAYGPGSVEVHEQPKPAWNLADLMAGKYTG